MFGMMLGGFAGIIIMDRIVIAMMMVTGAFQVFGLVRKVEYTSP